MSGNSAKVVKASKEEEEECSNYVDTFTKKECTLRNVTHPLRYYEFTQEEMKALEECDKESFYQRCLPLSTLFATVTYAAIRAGCLSRSPHFGVFPKVMCAALMGYFYGRLSSIPDCDQKLREILSSDSQLGKVLRNYHLNRNKDQVKPIKSVPT